MQAVSISAEASGMLKSEGYTPDFTGLFIRNTVLTLRKTKIFAFFGG